MITRLVFGQAKQCWISKVSDIKIVRMRNYFDGESCMFSVTTILSWLQIAIQMYD